MKHSEKEAYLREYSLLKAQGKPFFPYAVAKDSVMACVVLTTIIGMSILFGAELGPKADPTTTTYVPRPEWYFFFLFELLRVIKPALLVPLAVGGLVALWRRKITIVPFVALAVMATVTAAASFGITRYRVGADVGLTVLAGVALDALWRWWRRRSADAAARSDEIGDDGIAVSPRQPVETGSVA